MFRSSLQRLILGTAMAGTLGLSLAPSTADAKFVSIYNHADLEWYSIDTEHFVVHYPQSRKTAEQGNDHYLTAEWTARKMAQVGEEMWPKMCAEFDYYLKEKIHIVVLNQADQLEGFTVPTLDWIEISANPGGTFYRGRGRMEWVSDVLVHEFAHVVSLKANATHSEGAMGVSLGGLYRDGIRDVDTGVELAIMDGDSVFWTEGGAEYWSDNTGYNWWTASRDQNIRMTILDDRQLDYDEWHTRSGKRGAGHWNDHERYYQQGYSFGQYLRQRFGHETYARFAIEYGKGWRANWETVIEDVLGIDAETLYNEWLEYVRERYAAQYERVKARGEIVGKELTGSPDKYAWSSPDKRDEHYAQKRYEREAEREKSGTYQWEPRTDPDGGYWGILNRATIVVHRADDDQVHEFTGRGLTDPMRAEEMALKSTSFRADFEHGWDFLPGGDGLVLTGHEEGGLPQSKLHAATNLQLEFDGYDWLQLVRYDMPSREKKDGNRTVQTRERKKFFGKQMYEEGSWSPIPNTLRGSDPAVSPDGKKVAFFQYTDGVLNLATINIDGTDKKLLTNFDDGTWLQTVDWSPDGDKLVFAIFRNFQQDLYTVNTDGSDLKPITWDQWEELDAHWAQDGKIYFSAEPDGIFNIYSYDPDGGEILQITNVIGGASTPQITSEGNLIYTYYTSYGWKVYALPADQFMNAPANHLFRTSYDEEEVQAALAFREDLSHWAEHTTKYKASKSLMAPTGGPTFQLKNDSRTDWDVSGGFWFWGQDFVEKHVVQGQIELGEDSFYDFMYLNQGWYPTLLFRAYHYDFKYESGYLLDLDDDTETTDDQKVFEVRNHQYGEVALTGLILPLNDVWNITGIGGWQHFGFKSTEETGRIPYLTRKFILGFLDFSNNSWLSRSPNPTFGRTVGITYQHGWTDVVYELMGGVSVDDGELLDNYQYNSGELRWTENIPLPTFGGIPFLSDARGNGHVFQVDTRIGMIDRNVDGNDEFRAGGQHPSYSGRNSLSPNTQFAGYPAYSLSGETMGMLNLAYRFPINKHIRKKIGPLFTYGIYGQLAGTAGNLWSFDPDCDTSPDACYESRYGDRIARDTADIHREIPFVDDAHKNGNYMLYDASAEVRVQSVLFHGVYWDSFARVAYGFNEIRGYGDVDGNDIYDTSDNAAGDELSNETEPAGVRVYIGLGTGW